MSAPTRHRRLDGCPRDLAARVERESGVFLPQGLLDALLIIDAGYPDLRSVRQLGIEFGLVKPHPNRREAEDQNFRQRIEPDRRLRVDEPKSDYDMPRTRSTYRFLEHRPTKNERLSGPRPAAEHDVARRVGASRCFSVNRATCMHHSSTSSGETLRLDFGHAVFDVVICCQAGSVARVRLISPDAYASSADLPWASPCASFSCLAFYRTDMD